MRVTIVTTWFPTHRSPGLGVFVARHAASMAAAGHDIRVVHLASASVDDGVRHDRVMGLPVVRLPMSLSRPHEVLAARQELTALTALAAELSAQKLTFRPLPIKPHVFFIGKG